MGIIDDVQPLIEHESFGGYDDNALENIKESINNSSYIWKKVEADKLKKD